MNKFLAAILLAFSGTSFAIPLNPLNHIVVFGDSLSDNGNFYEYTQHRIPPSPPYFQGRFSNGPVWVEQLISTYLPHKDTSQYLSNYAYGGAGVVSEGEDVLLSLTQEVDTYLLVKLGKIDPNALHIIWVGANNYLAVPAAPEKEIKKVNDGVTLQVERLVKAGAKHIALFNLPNLGKTPLAQKFNIQQPLSKIALLHNDTLKTRLKSFEQAFPEVNWLYVDINATFEEVIENPSHFNFTNVSDACYDSDTQQLNVRPQTLAVASVSQFIKKSDLSCKGYLFFDLIHPTGVTHHILAEKIYEKFLQSGITFE